MTQDVFARLKDAAGPKGFSEDASEIAPHLTEWRGKYTGHSPLLLKPGTVEQVAAILAICQESGTAIVPQGGNTGLVGGQIPFHGEVLLSTARLNRIRRLDVESHAVIAEAGVTLAAVQAAAAEKNLLFPLSLASEGSCSIGGNLSTNAGGVHVLRYGMARDLVLGLEVVLADGRVLEMLRTLRKDNTGYDLKQLFLGAEGTLGVITAAALKLFPAPKERAVAFVALPDPRAAVALLGRMQAETGGLLSAFELIPRIALELVLAHIPGTSDPLRAPSPWYALIETHSGAPLRPVLEEALASAISDGLATDAAIAASQAQVLALWKLRESISEAQKHEGASIKHDVSVPIAAIPDFLTRATKAVADAVPGARSVSFGHVGDGNLHFNFSAPRGGDSKAFLARWDQVQLIVHDIVREFDGSISAEHGIGVMKVAELSRYKSHEELDVMRAMKAALDPKNILNPGKLVPKVMRL